MKKFVLSAVVALVIPIATFGQEPKLPIPIYNIEGFSMPDSLSHYTTIEQQPSVVTPNFDLNYPSNNSEKFSPIIDKSKLPKIAIDQPWVIRAAHGTISISNGQTHNYSPYPNGHLDARTLSFPTPMRSPRKR